MNITNRNNNYTVVSARGTYVRTATSAQLKRSYAAVHRRCKWQQSVVVWFAARNVVETWLSRLTRTQKKKILYIFFLYV